MEFNFHFVNKGQIAPENIEKNNFWLDVGNRVSLGVIDHHHNEVDENSAAELICNVYKQYILPHFNDDLYCNIYLHESPDLDALFTTWLLRKILEDNIVPENNIYVQELVNWVTENDQGLLKNIDPRKNWVVVYRTVLNTSGVNNDIDIVKHGLKIIDKVYTLLSKGNSLDSICEKLITIQAKLSFEQAYRDYLEDIDRGIKFQLRLPKTKSYSNSQTQWSLVDGLYLREPKSELFRELARSDFKNSELGLGFTLLVTSLRIENSENRNLIHYIISTDPWSGLHLENLGSILEKKEQNIEDLINLKTLQGRERVEQGKGRFGTNIISPWYDGRGHFFTIVDSPSITIDNKRVCASQISEIEMLNTIWEYGDPAKFVHTDYAFISMMIPVRITSPDFLPKNAKLNSNELFSNFSEEIRQTFSKSGFEEVLQVIPLQFTNRLTFDHLKLSQSFVIFMGLENAICYIGFKLQSSLCLRELITAIKKLREFDYQSLLQEGLQVVSKKENFILSTVKLNPVELNLGKIEGNAKRILHRLVDSISNDFHNRIACLNHMNSLVNVSDNNEMVFYGTERGFALFFSDEENFESDNYSKLSLENTMIVLLATLQKITLKNLVLDFIKHRSIAPTNNEIISDRWKLMKIEQILFFDTITDNDFQQKSYENIRLILDIDKKFNDAKQKIESLAAQVKDIRTSFSRLIGTVITIIIAPFALTTGFFSGIHMDKSFAEKYTAFFPESSIAGWIQFVIIFGFSSILSYGVFALLKLFHIRYINKQK